MFRIVLAILVLASTSSAHAARIKIERLDDLVGISVVGELRPGDGERFQSVLYDVLARGVRPFVMFSSPGGSLDASITIGRAIHGQSLPTLVLPDDTCASACALAWTAGRPRLLSRSSRLGYHQASRDIGFGPVASAKGSARAASYLADVGASADLLSFAIRARPEAMAYLDPRLAIELGLDVKWLDASATTRRAYAPSERLAAGGPPEDMPDDANMMRAIANTRAAYREGGAAKLVQASRACWATVQRNGSARSFQYCTVLDVTAEYLFNQARRSAADRPPKQIRGAAIRERVRRLRSLVVLPELLPFDPLKEWGGRTYAVLEG